MRSGWRRESLTICPRSQGHPAAPRISNGTSSCRRHISPNFPGLQSWSFLPLGTRGTCRRKCQFPLKLEHWSQQFPRSLRRFWAYYALIVVEVWPSLIGHVVSPDMTRYSARTRSNEFIQVTFRWTSRPLTEYVLHLYLFSLDVRFISHSNQQRQARPWPGRFIDGYLRTNGRRSPFLPTTRG